MKKFDFYSVFLHAALVVLCATTLLLAQENRKMRQMMEPAPSGPMVGQGIEPIQWLPLDGETENLELSGDRESFLLVFTTDCPSCRENQGAWGDLYRNVGETANVVGISLSELDATRGYRETHNLPFEVGVPTEPRKLADTLGISAVPMTIRVGADGRVLGSWSGVLSADLLSELSTAGRG